MIGEKEKRRRGSGRRLDGSREGGVGVPLEVEAGGSVICLATVAQKEQTKIRDPKKLP